MSLNRQLISRCNQNIYMFSICSVAIISRTRYKNSDHIISKCTESILFPLQRRMQHNSERILLNKGLLRCYMKWSKMNKCISFFFKNRMDFVSSKKNYLRVVTIFLIYLALTIFWVNTSFVFLFCSWNISLSFA